MRTSRLFLITALLLMLCSALAHAQTPSPETGGTDVPGLDILGHGYDVFDRYADQNSIKPYALFDWVDKSKSGIKDFWAPEYVILKNLSSHSQNTISGMSGREYSKALAAKVGLSVNAFFFKGSVESGFKIQTNSLERNYHVTYMDVTKKWLIQFDDRGNNYLSVLNARFKRDLDEMPPNLLFETYGTHYIFSAVLGGRADFTSHTTMTKKMKKKEIEAATRVRFQRVTGKTSFAAGNESKLEESNTRTNLYVIGGNSEYAGDIRNSEQYRLWADGIAQMPVLVDFVDDKSLAPIWSLTENKERRSELEQAFQELCNAYPLPAETASTPADVAFQSEQLEGFYTIQQKVNRRYVDAWIKGGSKDYRLVTRNWQNDATQQWRIMPVEGDPDTYTIQQKINMRYVDAHENGKHDYGLVTRRAQSNDTQKWIILPVEGEPNTYRIQQKSNRRYVDAWIKGGSKDFRLVTRSWQNDDTQKWVILKAGNNSTQ